MQRVQCSLDSLFGGFLGNAERSGDFGARLLLEVPQEDGIAVGGRQVGDGLVNLLGDERPEGIDWFRRVVGHVGLRFVTCAT